VHPNTDLDSLGAIFVDPAAYADPVSWHDKAAQIRVESPIMRVSVDGYPPFWAVTTHAYVLEVERHPDIFTNAPSPVLTRLGEESHDGPEVKTLIYMDGEEHRAHRAVISDHFKPREVSKLVTRVEQFALASIDKMAALGDRCDFMHDVVVPYPLHAIMAMLGLSEADHPRMLRLAQELFAVDDPDMALAGKDQTDSGEVFDSLLYFAHLNRRRRRAPKDDLASTIAGAVMNGEPLSDTDAFAYYLVLTAAGQDTTASVIGGALLALLDHPDQLQLLRDDPTLIPRAVDEFVRYVAPVKHFLRTCRRPFKIADVTFQPGDLVLLSFASATRDETVFKDAQRLDVQRESDGNHLGFGFGRHYCLGSHVARLEIRAFYQELLRRLQHIELAGEPTWARSNFTQGPKSIPVSYALR
jgi:cytochrome P450